MNDARTRAASRRRSWSFGFVSPDQDSPPPAGEDILETVWAATLDAWAFAGRELPTYTRAEMPGRLVRLGEDG